MTTILIALAFFGAGFVWGRFPGIGGKITAAVTAGAAWAAQQWDAIAPMIGMGG